MEPIEEAKEPADTSSPQKLSQKLSRAELNDSPPATHNPQELKESASANGKSSRVNAAPEEDRKRTGEGESKEPNPTALDDAEDKKKKRKRKKQKGKKDEGEELLLTEDLFKPEPVLYQSKFDLSKPKTQARTLNNLITRNLGARRKCTTKPGQEK